LQHDVSGYVDYELQNRREAGYPPYARLALLRLDAADESLVRGQAAGLARVARRTEPVGKGLVQVLGPTPAPIEKIRGRYRYRIVLRCRERSPLRSVAQSLDKARGDVDRRVRTSLDIDPIHML
jgi:primosomal protein N' (replication factor Y)